jgi:EAL domain-containing protein (putative c-di-GMP-specific phosphodiesterase class I)/PAS domain-containing protein
MTALAASGPAADILRAERDRYVAFAFAAADLLLEVDENDRIIFAVGALRSVTRRDSATLIGRPFAELLAESDRPIVRLLLTQLKNGGRLFPVAVRLAEPAGTTVIAGGCRLPGQRAAYQITLTIPSAVPAATDDGARDSATGLLDKENFARVAEERLRHADGGSYKLSLVEIEGLDDLRRHSDQELAAGLLATLGRQLRAQSADGDAAGQLADGRYGIIHTGNFDAATFERQVSEMAAAAAPACSIAVASSTMDLDRQGLSEADAARTLVYAINTFSSARGGEFTLSSLADGFQQLVADTAARVRTLRSTLSSGEFSVVFQPIVSLKDGAVHHYEALSRFPTSGPDGASPAEIVQFAEKIGVIADFDLVVCERVVSVLEDTKPERPAVAVNISGRSLESAIFTRELESLAKRNAHLKAQLLFEITESARIAHLEGPQNFINSLRQRGFRVCLDDFGAGSASFHYLNAFTVDFVKIDGKYIRNLFGSPRDRAFLRAMALLCQELGTATIAEMIEQEAQAEEIATLGVGYGQGWLFGRPAPGFATPPPRTGS